jgi:hypothetical protein
MNEIGLLLANVWCLAFSDILFDSQEEKIRLSKIYVVILITMIVANLLIFIKRTPYALLKEWFAIHY